jgi:predicted HTH transcriptional regulator
MKEKILQYIKENPNSSHHKVAKALSISEIDALKTLQELVDGDKVSIIPMPLGNEIESNCSCFYYAI